MATCNTGACCRISFWLHVVVKTSSLGSLSDAVLILVTKYPEEAAPQHKSSCTKRCQFACGHLPPLCCLAALQQLPWMPSSFTQTTTPLLQPPYCTALGTVAFCPKVTFCESLCSLALRILCLFVSQADCIKEVCLHGQHCISCLVLLHGSPGIIIELMPVTQEIGYHGVQAAPSATLSLLTLQSCCRLDTCAASVNITPRRFHHLSSKCSNPDQSPVLCAIANCPRGNITEANSESTAGLWAPITISPVLPPSSLPWALPPY